MDHLDIRGESVQDLSFTYSPMISLESEHHPRCTQEAQFLFGTSDCFCLGAKLRLGRPLLKAKKSFAYNAPWKTPEKAGILDLFQFRSTTEFGEWSSKSHLCGYKFKKLCARWDFCRSILSSKKTRCSPLLRESSWDDQIHLWPTIGIGIWQGLRNVSDVLFLEYSHFLACKSSYLGTARTYSAE